MLQKAFEKNLQMKHFIPIKMGFETKILMLPEAYQHML